MNKIITLVFVSLILFGIGIVSANHDAPVDNLNCLSPVASLSEWDNCHPQQPNEPSEPQSIETSSGTGTGGSSRYDDSQQRYNQCVNDLWFIAVKPSITSSEGVKITDLVELFTSEQYAICYPNFWFEVFKPLFFNR